MALSWNEIKDRALKFSNEWADETRERAEKDSFWNDFFYVFGILRRRVASFEEPVKKLGNKQGFIDLFWKGTLLVEHKSKGNDLDKAFEQATDYFPGLKEHELPKYILVTDFERIKLYDLDERTENEFVLKDFHKNVKLFGFIAGYQKRSFKEEDPVNIKAAELMGKLHDQLKDFGYEVHPLEVFLVRLLFVLFADDTGIFEKDIFKEFIDQKTKEDGSDLGALLAQFFQVLNTPVENRLKNLDDDLNAFPYINGKLFEEPLPIASFNSSMRNVLLESSGLDWGKISPAIFGSLFQSVMNKKERRNLGAHYTSETNILKLTNPLFLDNLRTEFKKIQSNKPKLRDFHKKLSELTFFDPACGCGNFLVITYRELRLLELDVLKALYPSGQTVIDISMLLKVNVDQFYGIEYEEFPAQIAQVAMWLVDHQANLLVSEFFGVYFARLPLVKSATIIHGNALTIPWSDIIHPNRLSYILGNPPFIGSKYQSSKQRKELATIVKGIHNGKLLDYVSAWYILAAQYIRNSSINVGFVSTNSITQGEQIGPLWNELINQYGIIINFAHTTFKWNSEAKGKAVVYCIIIGFSQVSFKNKSIYMYEDINSDPHRITVKNINPYLVDAENVLISRRATPICHVPPFIIGSKPLDGGHLCLSVEEKKELVTKEPLSKKYIRPLIGAKELLYNKERYCLWLQDVTPNELRRMKLVMSRVKAVEADRNNGGQSKKSCADRPHLFGDNRQPVSNYLVIPKLSSEYRKYIPMGFFTPDTVVTDLVSILPDATIYHFGILTSILHMTWVKYVCGRFKSDYRYTNLVYNNFIWPPSVSEKQKKSVEKAAQDVLDIRAKFTDSNLADLYDPLAMPVELTKAHGKLDKAVDKCYRPQAFKTENDRIQFLFKLYKNHIKSES